LKRRVLSGHPNLRAFISHCGQNSLTESAHAGVPLICIPLFGDQMRNAKTAEKRQTVVLLHKHEISKEMLISALNEILYGAKYQKSAKLLAQMIREKPFPSKERLLKYTEFAIKYGPIENFDLAANKLTFFQYYLIDIIVPAILVPFLLGYWFLRVLSLFLLRGKFKIE
uniref:glucuronosyltransferase n=1 Tax=Gongylonema pulchrum TaxID=637853 RepID=A0A183DCD1_9BILA